MGCTMDSAKVAQRVEALNGLTARDALCLLVSCMLAVLDEAPSEEERQQSLDGCIDLLVMGSAGSNPATPTNEINLLRNFEISRRALSRADWPMSLLGQRWIEFRAVTPVTHQLSRGMLRTL